jgi:hypothetical protein
MNLKGQGSLEYLLLIGGAILVAAVVLSVVTNLTGPGADAIDSRKYEAICAGIPNTRCGTIDPDGSGDLVAANCVVSDDSCIYTIVTP